MKFRLMRPHYVVVLNREDYFEQKETPMGGTEAVTHRHRVPRYLDPDDPSQWNWDPVAGQYRRPGTFRYAFGETGWLVITDKAEGKQHELVLKAPALTTEMEGIDDAAKAAVLKLQEQTLRPFESLPIAGGMNAE